jgi:hypothetical protein
MVYIRTFYLQADGSIRQLPSKSIELFRCFQYVHSKGGAQILSTYPLSTSADNHEAAVLFPSLICLLTVIEGWPLMPV